MTSSTPYSVTEHELSGLSGYSQPVYAAQLDRSAAEIGAQFSFLINDIRSIVTPYTTSSTVAAPLTAADRSKLTFDISVLRHTLTNGFTLPGTTATQYYTVEMANQANFIFESLQAVGVDTSAPTFSFASLEQAQEWQALVASSLVLNSLFEFVSGHGNRSLQSLIELNYVATGNDLIAGQLDALQDALSITKTSLDNLTSLQAMHNQIQISSMAKFSSTFDLTATGMSLAQYIAAYKTAASSYFGAPIAVTTAMIPTDPLKQFELATSIEDLGTQGIMPDLVAGFNKLRGQLDSVGPFNAFYAKYNAGADDFTVWEIGDFDDGAAATENIATIIANRTPSFTGVKLGNVQGHDLTFYVQGAGPDTTAAENSAFVGRYGLVTANCSMKLGPTAPTTSNVLVFTGGSTANAVKMYDDIVASRLLGPRIIPLTENTTRYFGITGMNITSVQNAVNRFAGILVTVPYPPPYSSYIWVGYDESQGTGQFVTDKRNPSAMFKARDDLIRIREALNAEIQALAPLTPPLASGDADPNTLLAKLLAVVADLNSSFTTTGTSTGSPITKNSTNQEAILGLKSWMIDNYNSADGSLQTGLYQQNLQFAITAGQSLNDTQNESIRRFLFIFEEYYKSASAILQQITQILQRIAQNVAR